MSITSIEEKKQVQRQAIMEVARDHFERFGYKRTVIDDIVREVGIAKGTFYLYFKSKDQLFLEIVQELHREMMAWFAGLFEQEGNAEDQIRLLVEMSFQAFEDYPLMARLLVDDPEFRMVAKLMEEPTFQRGMQDLIERLRALLKTGIQSGELREDLNLDITPLVLGMLKFLHYYTGLLARHGVNRKQFIDGLVDLALNGLLRR